jgi:NAD(P)-dependent dehydrogenase (short-subunit alcohol dehydrogenase family)
MQKVALVTGSATGAGRACAVRFANLGFAVAVNYSKSEAEARDTAELVKACGVPVLVHKATVGDESQVKAMVARTKTELGGLDLLVNNAGMTGPVGPPDEVDVDGWQATVGVNLTGSFLCAREAFGIMRRQDPQGGRIVNNGSIAAHTPRPGGIAYTATKHAITGLTKTIALDGRPFGIACGQFDVGNAATDMTARMREGIVQPNGERMVEPTFDPEHVADAVRYMVGLPLDANVPFLTVMATTMPYLGRG